MPATTCATVWRLVSTRDHITKGGKINAYQKAKPLSILIVITIAVIARAWMLIFQNNVMNEATRRINNTLIINRIICVGISSL